MTAYARPEDRAKALAAGFRAHLSKPLDPESLLREISEAVRSQPMQAIQPPYRYAFGDSLIPHSFILFNSVL